MADGLRPAMGLSIGNTNLAAVTANQAITRKPVLTLFRHRSPEVGVPSENPSLTEPGLVLSDFVGRLTVSSGIRAADGSVHRTDVLIADALRALAYDATGGTALPEYVAVTYPSHWSSKAVDALGGALSRVSEWSDRTRPLTLIPDAAATLLAVRANPGMPARGTVAVCDFGGSGTSVTLMDAAGDYRALAPTVRYRDFGGDTIDQRLLSVAMADVPNTVSFAAIGSLSRLRAQCRSVKEQLSSSTSVTLTEDGDVRLTREQFDETIRASLDDLVELIDKMLARNGVRDLTAIVTAGGGAYIPLVTTTLSQHLHVPVVTTRRPHLTAAIGATMRAARGSGSDSSAASVSTWATSRIAPLMSPTREALKIEVPVEEAPPDLALPDDEPKMIRWYRRPALTVMPAVIVVLLVGIAAAIGLGAAGNSVTVPAPSTTPTPSRAAAQPADPEAPPPTTGTNPTTPQASMPDAAAHEMAPAAPATPKAQAGAPVKAVPGVTGPIPADPIPGLDKLDQILQAIAGGAGLGDITQLLPHSSGH